MCYIQVNVFGLKTHRAWSTLRCVLIDLYLAYTFYDDAIAGTGRNEMLSGMRVIDIARKANVSSETVRYYSRLGLLKPSRDLRSCYKMFDEKDYARLLFVRDARALGMSIADVQVIVDASRHSGESHPQVMALFRERLDAVREKIKALKPIERQLMGVIRQWERSSRGAPTGRGVTKVIDRWPEKTI